MLLRSISAGKKSALDIWELRREKGCKDCTCSTIGGVSRGMISKSSHGRFHELCTNAHQSFESMKPLAHVQCFVIEKLACFPVQR